MLKVHVPPKNDLMTVFREAVIGGFRPATLYFQNKKMEILKKSKGTSK